MAAQRLATEQDAYNKGKTGTPTIKKLCTATRASALGCTCGSYSGKRIVPVSSLAAKLPTYTYAITFRANNYSTSDCDYIKVALFDNDTPLIYSTEINLYQPLCEAYPSGSVTKNLTFDANGVTVNESDGSIKTMIIGTSIYIFRILVKYGVANGKWSQVGSMGLTAANQSLTYDL